MCRQINDETASLPYALNDFHITTCYNADVWQFLSCLALKRQTISVLRLRSSSEATLHYFANHSIEGFRGIRRVELVIERNYMSSSVHKLLAEEMARTIAEGTCMRSPQFEVVVEVLESFFEGGGNLEAKFVRVERAL